MKLQSQRRKLNGKLLFLLVFILFTSRDLEVKPTFDLYFLGVKWEVNKAPTGKLQVGFLLHVDHVSWRMIPGTPSWIKIQLY